MPRKKKIVLPLETVIASAHNLAMEQHFDLITPEIFVFCLLDNWCQLDQEFYYERCDEPTAILHLRNHGAIARTHGQKRP